MLFPTTPPPSRTFWALLAIAGFPAWCGCGAASAEAPEHEPHHHEAAVRSFAEATADVAQLHAELAVCWAAETSNDQAEHLLHEIEELLHALPEAAVDSDLPKADWFRLRDGVRAWVDALLDLESALQADWQQARAAGKRYSTAAETAVADLQRLVRLAYGADESLASDPAVAPPAAAADAAD